MEEKTLSPALRILAKWCAILSLMIAIYPMVFLVPTLGAPDPAWSDPAQRTTHTHLSGNTLLLFMVGYLFSYTRLKRAKKIWPTVGALSIIITVLGLFLGVLPFIIIGYTVFVISVLVMSIGILGWV